MLEMIGVAALILSVCTSAEMRVCLLCPPPFFLHLSAGLLLCRRWILPLSHDEVVSGKGSLLDKCGFAGSPFEDRIKTLKTLFGYQVGSPGRPLIFMGAEIGQGREWKENRYVRRQEYVHICIYALCMYTYVLLQRVSVYEGSASGLCGYTSLHYDLSRRLEAHLPVDTCVRAEYL